MAYNTLSAPLSTLALSASPDRCLGCSNMALTARQRTAGTIGMSTASLRRIVLFPMRKLGEKSDRSTVTRCTFSSGAYSKSALLPFCLNAIRV